MNTAAASEARIHAAGIAAAIDVPDRIARAVYSDSHMFPPSKPLTEMLADCSRNLRAAEARCAAGHWTASLDRLRALRMAEDALLALIVGEPVTEQNLAA